MYRQAVCGLVALLVAGCGGVLPRESHGDAAAFQTYDQVRASYDRIEPGKTKITDLSAIGFDPLTTPNVEFLSSTDIVAHFMPVAAITLDRVPPGVRSCIEAQDRCSAYRFRLAHSAKRRNGGIMQDMLSFSRDTVSTGWAVEIIFLVQDGFVVYKTITASPFLRSQENKVQPLGPLQNLGDSLKPPQDTP